MIKQVIKRLLRRRMGQMAIAIVLCVVLGVVAGMAAIVIDQERVAENWVGVTVSGNSAQIHEVIDYDFGSPSKHGIFRDVPGLDPSAPIAVFSLTAPSQFEVIELPSETRIKIGDPDRTINGRHRYTIDYPLKQIVVGDTFDFNVVGTDWTVPIQHTETHIVADREFTEFVCQQGTTGSTDACEISQVGAGHLMVTVGKLAAGEAVTIRTTLGATLPATPVLPAGPSGPVNDPGHGFLLPGIAALVASLSTIVLGASWVRRAGREEVVAGAAAAAAYPLPGMAMQRLTEHEMYDLTTIEFSPPSEISAVTGAIIIEEDVPQRVTSAWLLEAALRKEVVLDTGTTKNRDPILRRGPTTASEPVERVLSRMFGGREEVNLGSYDSTFKYGADGLISDLQDWYRSSSLWNADGDKTKLRMQAIAIVIMIGGIGGVVVASAVGNWTGGPWVVLVAVGALAAGFGFGALASARELRVRTVEGSALWLRIESFRKFLHDSDSHHIEAAAEMGLLRQYTAWAIALDETSAWTKAIEQTAKGNAEFGNRYAADIFFIGGAGRFASSVSSSATAPSPSGSGSSGGGAGGGGGGGGGGSW